MQTEEQKEGDSSVLAETPLIDILTAKACPQLEAGIKYRQPKIDRILQAEELYFNLPQKTIKGRFNIPLPIVSGFVDTQLSKIDDEITVNFDHTETADKIKSKKVGAAWEYDSAPTRGMWGIKDILVKKLALFSGRGIYKCFSESDPEYANYLDIIDPFDFIAEPDGGWHLENHLFCGVQNIFKTKEELRASPYYDQKQVEKLIAKWGEADFKEAKDEMNNRQSRLGKLGFDAKSNNYVGSEVFSLVEWNMEHEGKRYYLLFEPKSKIGLRAVPLEEITGTPKKSKKPIYMFRSWATNPDFWNFWSKAPVDDVVPIALALKTITNFMFDDVNKKLWGQRIYDPEIIVDPSQLEWDRPDKLIMANVPQGKVISAGVYELPTGDNSSMTINLVDYFRGFVATETGITNQTKGQSDEKILGIAKINEGEVADRLGLLNKSYVQCYAELGQSYLLGLKLCMVKSIMIRMIGENGTESEELTREDLEFTSEPDIRITGGKTEARRNLEVQQQKENALLKAIGVAPETINKKLAQEFLLENGGWQADEIAALFDVTLFGNEKESVKASQAIQDALNGKPLQLYQGATTRFAQKIIDFVKENTGTKNEDVSANFRLNKYVLAHRSIIIENMVREKTLMDMLAMQAQGPEAAPADAIAPNTPTPATPI